MSKEYMARVIVDVGEDRYSTQIIDYELFSYCDWSDREWGINSSEIEDVWSGEDFLEYIENPEPGECYEIVGDIHIEVYTSFDGEFTEYDFHYWISDYHVRKVPKGHKGVEAAHEMREIENATTMYLEGGNGANYLKIDTPSGESEPDEVYLEVGYGCVVVVNRCRVKVDDLVQILSESKISNIFKGE